MYGKQADVPVIPMNWRKPWLPMWLILPRLQPWLGMLLEKDPTRMMHVSSSSNLPAIQFMKSADGVSKKCSWKWWCCTGFVSMGFAWLLHPVGIVVAYLSFNFDGFPCVFPQFSLILDGSPGSSSSSSHFSRGFWRRWPDVSTVGPGSPALSQRLGTNAGSGWTPWGAGGTTWGWVNVTYYILLSLIFILIKR